MAAPSESKANCGTPLGTAHNHGEGEPLIVMLFRWEFVAYMGLLVFLCTMSYELGYAYYWHMPFGVVAFRPENAFSVFLGLFLLGCFGWFPINAMLSKETNRWFKTLILGSTILIVLLLSIRLMFHFGALLSVMALLILAFTFWALSTAFFLGWTREEWDAHAMRIFGRVGLVLAALLFFLPMCASLFGYSQAGGRTVFLVLDSEPELVVLRMFGTDCVCGTLDPNAKQPQLENSFKIISLGDKDGPSLRLKEIGHVEPAKQSAVSAWW